MAAQVVLTQHQEEFVAALIAEGIYKDASEAVAAGLLRIERERDEYASKLATLRAEVAKGFDDIDQGRYVDVAGDDLDEFIANLGRRTAQRVEAEHTG